MAPLQNLDESLKALIQQSSKEVEVNFGLFTKSVRTFQDEGKTFDGAWAKDTFAKLMKQVEAVEAKCSEKLTAHLKSVWRKPAYGLWASPEATGERAFLRM